MFSWTSAMRGGRAPSHSFTVGAALPRLEPPRSNRRYVELRPGRFTTLRDRLRRLEPLLISVPDVLESPRTPMDDEALAGRRYPSPKL
jgi:hypothetical protein